MSNNAYLLNTNLDASDPQRILQAREQARQGDLKIWEAAYRIPFPWLCCFRQGDLRSFEWRPEPDPDDEDPAPITVALLVVAVPQAIANLRAALPLFEAATGETTIARQHWQRALDALQALPFAYLALEALEIILAVDRDEAIAQLHAALAADASALPALKALSDYQDGALPYGPEVLYDGTPGNYAHPQRLSNAVALDAAIDTRFLTPATPTTATPRPTPTPTPTRAAPPPAPAAFGKRQLIFAGAIVAALGIAMTQYGAGREHDASDAQSSVELSPQYQAVCLGAPLRTAANREKALQDGYEVLGRFDCISKASFSAMQEQRAKAGTPQTN